MEQKFYICKHCGNIIAKVKAFAIKYVEHLINGTHDSSCSHHHRLWIFHFFCL